MQLSGLQYGVGDRYICKKEDRRGGGSLDAAHISRTAIWEIVGDRYICKKEDSSSVDMRLSGLQ